MKGQRPNVVTRETIILFTRYPRAGRTKTRLIPKLGAEGAAQLQREMTEHVLARVWPLVRERRLNLEVWFEDGSQGEMRRWLGADVRFVAQGEGDLGARMLRAMERAFRSGVERAIIIGADCPELDARLLSGAFKSLRSHSLVFGPARDGGYYLLGSREPYPFLFQNINWGTGDVLATSLRRARDAGIDPWLLPELTDIDGPADLPVWEKARHINQSVSVIIPVVNEAKHLPRTLEQAATNKPGEIIVADGGSHDETVRIAKGYGARVVTCGPNRARQMNAGAALARGEVLLFLHADTVPPRGYCQEVLAAFRAPKVVGGAFRFAIADPFPGRCLLEASTNLRSHLWRMPYGDQAIFVRRWAFDQVGGFPDLPIMEDYEFIRRLRRLGKLALLDAAVLTSGRRWQRLGFVRTTLINKLMILGYNLGVPPARLAAYYSAQAGHPKPQLDAPEILPERFEKHERV
ncbi:MAG TPA: TIGR04283 family arsenosugar biosynthesis glycosyltransferase [Patescibacteria group bacterium]|nr:TIGR04283 family arsenosugar biosynthesis glycosyltransferase [Patescibacteria group bacterium]